MVDSDGAVPVTPSRASASGEASAAHSAIATNDCAPVITADSAIASTPVRPCRIPRGLRGSATCASSPSGPRTPDIVGSFM